MALIWEIIIYNLCKLPKIPGMLVSQTRNLPSKEAFVLLLLLRDETISQRYELNRQAPKASSTYMFF